MNNEINDNCKTFKNKNNCQIKYSDSFNTIKRNNHKKHEELNDVQDNYSNLYVKIPAKRCSKKIAKSKNYLGNSLRRKKTAFERKEKEEKEAKEIKGESDFHKIKTFNPKNKNKINSQEEYFSPQYKKRPNIGLNKNDNDNDILKLISLTNKIYENEEHFQKNIISKKGDFDTLNTIKKNDSFISEEIIKKKYKNRFFLNEESICKDNSNANLLKELNDKNKEYKGRKSNVSSSSKGKSSNYNFKRSRKKNGSSNFKKLKIKNEIEKKEDGGEDKNKIRKAPKLSNDMINNSRTFKENISTKLLRMNASKQSVYENNEIKGKNNKKKSPNKINNNKSKIITDDTKNENENIKNKKKDSKGKKFRFFCCLNNNGNDSDEFCN
jgi:hypothetical protein